MKFLFALVSLSLFSSGLSQSCSSPDELEGCVYKSSFMLNRDVNLPSNIEEMKRHCGDAQDSLTCLIGFNEKCVTGPPQVSLKRIYGMVQRGLNDRCSNDDKLQEFVDHLSCLRENNKMEFVRQCADKHVKHLEQIIDVPGPQRVGPLCCSFKYFHDCVKDTVNEQCGEDVADFFENLLNEYRDELLMSMCDKFSDMDKCAANIPANVWAPMKEIMDKTDKIEHNYKTTIPVMYRLLDQFIKKN